MKSKSFYGMPAAPGRGRLPRALGAAVIAMAMIVLCTACSSKTDDGVQDASVTARNVTLTADQRQHIHLYTVAPSSFHKTVETTGAVDFDNDQATSVLAPFSGPVSRLLVSPGDHVRKGDPLAMVDSPDFAAAVSQRENEQAQTDAASAEADLDAALQALVSLNIDPQTIKDVQAGRPVSHIEGVIRSPITGTVAEKLITPGELLQAGTTPCFTVADLSRVWVMAQVSASELASVSVGDPAEVVTGTTAKNFAGTVDNIAALVNPDTRSVIARVVVENPGDFLKKQMYVSVRIHSRQQSTGVLVPVSAILRDDENLPFAYVVQPDGSFARQHVTLGYRSGDQYVIPEGLKAGDQMVVDGGIFVQFMQDQ